MGFIFSFLVFGPFGSWNVLSNSTNSIILLCCSFCMGFSFCVLSQCVAWFETSENHGRTGRGGGTGAAAPPPSLLGKQSQSGNIRFTVGQYWLIIKINVTNSVNFVGNSVNSVGNMLSNRTFS